MLRGTLTQQPASKPGAAHHGLMWAPGMLFQVWLTKRQDPVVPFAHPHSSAREAMLTPPGFCTRGAAACTAKPLLLPLHVHGCPGHTVPPGSAKEVLLKSPFLEPV